MLADLVAELLMTPGHSAPRRLRRRPHHLFADRQSPVAAGRSRVQMLTNAAGGQLPQLLAELGRSGDQQSPELVHRLGARLDRATAGRAQGATASTGPSRCLGVRWLRVQRSLAAA